MREFVPGDKRMKELETMIWRDYLENYKQEFNSDRNVVGSLGSPVDIFYKYIHNYYIVAFSCRTAALCSIQAHGFGMGGEDVIADQDGIVC